MASKLDLYNDALLALGQERLSALSDATAARYALDDAYDRALAYCLERGFWNWAMRTVELSASVSIAPSFGWSYAVERPSDWVRTYQVSADPMFNTPLLDYRDENALWYCNVDPLYVRYVSNDTSYGYDLSLWPESFVEYVSLRLAIRACKRITGSEPSDDLHARAKRAASAAGAKDAMDEPPGFPPTGTWVNSRGGGMSNRSRWDGSFS